MNDAETAALVEDMAKAKWNAGPFKPWDELSQRQRKFAINDMLPALAVAKARIRNDVLQVAIEKIKHYQETQLDFGPDDERPQAILENIADELEAMKELPNE